MTMKTPDGPDILDILFWTTTWSSSTSRRDCSSTAGGAPNPTWRCSAFAISSEPTSTRSIASIAAASGALVFARTKEAAAALASAFELRQIDKRYLALVRGTPPDAGTIDHPIPKGESGPRVPAVTRFVRVARSEVERCSLVLAIPESGRTHQIRRHLRHLGHPLIGDVNYGRGELNRHYRARYELHRLALHASSIAFAHPTTGVRLALTAPLPEDLRLVLARLELPALSNLPALWDLPTLGPPPDSI